MSFVKQSSALVLLAIAFINAPFSVWAQTLAPHQQLARDIHKELVEINTVTATGDTHQGARPSANDTALLREQLMQQASLGIAIGGQDGANADALIKNADAAMFHAKSVGRNGYQFYAASISKAATDELTLESDMRQALENNMFYLVYQPKFHVTTNRMMGMEALIRCRCLILGAIGADRIIAIAEETGLIHSLGDFVLRSALAQLKQWEQQGYRRLKVSVNLSPLQFRNLRLIHSVEAALADSGVAPGQLELEITESAVMHDVEQTIETMHALKRLGVSLSIDDFGVGYSSLGYLARLPVDCLKIDRSFVTDLPSNKHEAIVARGIISMARGLSLTTVAEGVETDAQLEFLKSNGCDQIQGYLLSRPISPEEITERFLLVSTNASYALA